MEFVNHLGTPSKQKKHVNSSPETLDKVELTDISARLLKSSYESGKESLDMVINILYFTLAEIKASEDLNKALNECLENFHPDNRSKFLSASRTATNANIPEETKAEIDERLQKEYIKNMEELDTFHAKSKEVIYAIDTTPVEARTKYLNNQYSWVNIGGKKTWKRGLTFSGIYDCTNQLFVSNVHMNYHKSKHCYGDVQDFIKQIQSSLRVAEQAATRVKFIDADRAYYDGELFAAAYLGLLTNQCEEPYDVKVIVPKKFTRNKLKSKIDFLEDPNSQIASINYIQLSKYTHPALINQCEAAGLSKKNSMYMVPVAVVAAVDEYSSKKNRTLAELRKEWQSTLQNVETSKFRIELLNDEYIQLQKIAGIKKPTRVSKLTQRKRAHKGHPTLLTHYNKIRSALIYKKSLEREKSEILKALMFFTVSLTPYDAGKFNPEKYIALIKVYHERWGIENGFKEDKSKFIRSSRSRKSTHRQWNLNKGMMLYNRWHVARMKMMLEIERKATYNRVPWDPRRPYFRRKLERKYGKILSAESYLLQLLETGIKLQLNRIFKG